MTYAVGYMLDGRYEIRQVLKPGSQGEVYVVFDHNEHVEGVLKLIDTRVLPLGAGPWDEARVLRQLSDDHILPILNADSIVGQPFIVTALAKHGTLENALAATGGLGLDVDQVVEWIRQACVGIARAHDVSLAHNDIKPANLFLNTNLLCLVGDFGLASLVPPPPLIGVARGATPETAAPEVAAGWPTRAPPASFQTDVYSLGATAYWLLAGRSPVDLRGITSFAAKMAAAAAQIPPRLREVAPHVPAAVAKIIGKTISRNPADRYYTVQELAAALGSRATKPRRWRRTDEHAGHLACWRGEASRGDSTYLVCLEHDVRPTHRVVTSTQASGRRINRGCRTVRARDWPRAVRSVISLLT